MTRVSQRAIILIAVAILAAAAPSALAFSILGHRVIALRVLHAVQQRPEDYPPFLSKIAGDDTLKSYFLGGTDAPDLGALWGVPRPSIQYSTHYEHPALWIKTLFELAGTDEKRQAYAWGWVVHEGADLQVHPWMDQHGLNYCDVGFDHTYFEVAMDGQFGATYVEYSDERVRGDSAHPECLLEEALATVRAARAHSPAYDRYIARVHERCSGSGALAAVKDDSRCSGASRKGDSIYSPVLFAWARDFELGLGLAATTGGNIDRTLLSGAVNAPSIEGKAFSFVLAAAIERAKQAVKYVSDKRTADNAEIVSLYGFAPARIRQMLHAAEIGDWQALDLNFDTGVEVHDPSLIARRQRAVEIALVLDSSGSMRENDPNDLRKRAAELLIDRSSESAAFTIVRFNHEVSVLAEHSTDRGQLRRAIDAVGADGGTMLCKATLATLDSLAGGEASEKVIVLLTDGKSQDDCDPAELARRGIRIFTVGLSAEANGALLQAIAAATNASYIHARTAADVQSVFDVIIAEALNQTAVADFSGKALPGATARFLLPVDPTIQALTFLLTWPGSSLNLTLVSPSGKRLSASLEGRTAPTYQMLSVPSPESGTWTASVKSVDVAPGSEPFRLRAAAETPVRLVLEPLASQGSPAMRATLAGFPTAGVHVRARVERPDGRSDDADVDQDGGSYVARYPRADVAGAYNFVWSALAGDVSRSAMRSVFIGDTAIQGGTVQSVEGQYVRWNRGALHGIRHGLPVTIFRKGQEIGRGRAIDVRAADADVEIDSVTGVSEIATGDEVRVELALWSADGGQP